MEIGKEREMAQNKDSLMKRYISTAEYHDRVAKREWAYAKNTYDGYHYEKSRDHYRRRDENRAKAETIRKELAKNEEIYNS